MEYWEDFKNNSTFNQISFSQYEIKKFADKLKDIVCLLIGCTREQLEDREFKEKELGEEWWYYTNTLFNNEDKELVSYTEANSFIKNSTKWYFIKPTPRVLLQQIGTDLFRNQLHPNTWINSLMSGYKLEGGFEGGERTASDGGYYSVPSYKGEYPNWIITDVRFPNELEAVKKHNGITIRINRGLVERTGKMIQGPEHISETALDNAEFDYFIENSGTIEELIKQVKEILIKEEIL